MIAFLAVCAVITAVERHWVDTVAIALVLIVNATVGFWQERKAASDVRALASLTTPTCTVLRDGAPIVLDAAEVVPGDVVLLESGDRVPADLRLIETNALRVDESMLTGEVLPVTKSPNAVPADTPLADRTDSAFSGTLVVAGRGRGVVTATGPNSELGAINALVQVDPGKTPLQVLTARLERSIGVVILLVAIGIVVAGLAIGNDLSESFRTGVALVVSAMPEAWPIVLTIALGVGVSRMAARHAVVRRLPSVETLGSTTVIGSDKTGTLTQNRLTVEAIWTASGRRDIEPGDEPNLTNVERDLVRAGALTNEARPDGEGFIGDAVDVAMLALAIHTDAIDEQERSRVPLADQPYEPDAGYSQTVRDGSDGSVLYVKGAPDKVLGFCTRLATPDGPASLDADAVLVANDEFGRAGLRVIAAAARPWDPGEDLDAELPSPTGLTFLGLEAMMDPPRPGVVDAVAACRDAGIHVMMITGDHLNHLPQVAQAALASPPEHHYVRVGNRSHPFDVSHISRVPSWSMNSFRPGRSGRHSTGVSGSRRGFGMGGRTGQIRSDQAALVGATLGGMPAGWLPSWRFKWGSPPMIAGRTSTPPLNPPASRQRSRLGVDGVTTGSP